MGKFNFKKIGGGSQYLSWAKWEEGDYIIGKFVEEGNDQFGNPCWVVETLETSLTEDSKGNPMKEEGRFTLNSAGSLKFKMQSAEKGDIIRVEYLGMTVVDNPKNPFHGKSCHDIDVQIDTGEAMESAAPDMDLDEDMDL